MTFAVLITAAGAGRRFGGPKQEIRLHGRSLLHWCLDAFHRALPGAAVCIIHPPGDRDGLDRDLAAWGSETETTLHAIWAEGGAERDQSVHNGLKALPVRVA